uniref:Rho-GAP domain-containing protein n=1 Tax=Trichobilharzia regenti TaxID=157069 RepID=A0AA85KD36_TRIRE|nr:unnamed protein product [Trichobilharzia regenti]
METISSIPSNQPLQVTINDYAYRLRYGVPEDSTVKLFREYYPHRFQELCMIHLSFLIDIPWNFLDQKTMSTNINSNSHNTTYNSTMSSNHSLFTMNPMNNGFTSGTTTTTAPASTPTTTITSNTNSLSTTNIGGATKAMLKRLWINWRLNSHSTKSDSVPEDLANNIICLIDRLDNDEACCVEGLFRKAGHTIRKRQLQEALLQSSFDSKLFQWDKYSFHDLAGALKSILIRLPVPLFTERLIPLFLQVSALRKFKQFHMNEQKTTSTVTSNAETTVASSSASSSSPSINEKYLIHLIESKQIKALRLLIQLLPITNLRILKRLLELLIRVKDLNLKNRMTSLCLGTIFGPVLLPQGILSETVRSLKNSKYPSMECQEKCLQLSKLTCLLIETGLDIFLLPYSLVQDICTNSPYLFTYKSQKLSADIENNNNNSSNNNGNSNTHKLFSSYHHHHHHSSYSTLKKQSVKFKDIPMLFLSSSSSSASSSASSSVSPSKNCCYMTDDHHDDYDDSPPLRTAIRFATPTPTSVANFRQLTSPTMQSTVNSNNNNNNNNSTDVEYLQRFLSSNRHCNTNSCMHRNYKQYLLNSYTDQPIKSKWNRSADEISLDYLRYSPREKIQKSISESQNDVVKANNNTTTTPTNCSQYPVELIGKTCRLQANSIIPSPNCLSPTKCSKYTKDNIDTVRIDCSKRKFGKRRRFTELRLPTTLSRTNAGGNNVVGNTGGGSTGHNSHGHSSSSSSHRRYIFSPCPPIPLLPFRR